MSMFPGTVKTGLTLPKVIGGISKTLNVANQIIPLYMQAKPMIQNAKSAFSVAKEIMAKPKNSAAQVKTTLPSKDSIQKKETGSAVVVNTNNPVFFV